jgi:ribulose 1,5-bisphosphate carboxylase large subunit-like protein
VSYPAGNAIRSSGIKATVSIRYSNLENGYGSEELFNVVFGEPHQLGVLEACRLTHMSWHDNSNWPGPAHGRAGIREYLAVPDRPLLCAPIKPSMGLRTIEHVALASAAAAGGADIVKDDELCLDTRINPLLERIAAMKQALQRVDAKKGERTLYVANLIGPRQTFLQRLEGALRVGAKAVMVAPGLMGLDVIEAARDLMSRTEPAFIFSHSTFASALTRSSRIGVGWQPWIGYQRGQGADCAVLPSTGGSFGISRAETDEAETASADEHPRWKSTICAHSGSLNSANWHRVRDAARTSDFVVTSGAGIFDHPLGARVGASDFRKALAGEQVTNNWLTQWTTVQ